MAAERDTKRHVKDPGRVRELAQRIAHGELSPVDLVRACLDRIAQTQPHVAAWREVDGERALAVAAERARDITAGRVRGALHGIPVGIKDIIDVEGLPTRCNCRALENVAPASADAEVVLAMKTAGAIVLGKAHTTEFAFFDPSPARNPHNTDHTPGGSSSGSAAAVACGSVPVSIGTQTMASVNRPAAYCGIAAFKPSTRCLSTFGIAALAPLYDTPGFYGATVDDAAFAFEAVAPAFLRRARAPAPRRSARIVTIDDPLIADASAEMTAAWQRMAGDFRARGNTVESRPSPVPFKRIGELHWTTMVYETARAQAGLMALPEDQVGQRLRAAILEGRGITAERYLSDRVELDRIRAEFFAAFADVDAFLWPAAPDTAPKGLASTGEPKYIAPWTVFGGPVVTVPAGTASNGLPLGCILAGRPGEDLAMCGLARQLTACS
jgi:aspartyl-tRNA(Asn)/glutamyl-tRNA(Gln) amidotransferase subunit A